MFLKMHLPATQMDFNVTTAAQSSPVSSTLGSSVGGVILLVLAALALVLLMYFALPLIGFAGTGIVAGSYAALWMSSIAIGNGVGVVSGSLFALCQSIGMVGIAFWPVLPVVLALLACILAGYKVVLHAAEAASAKAQWWHQAHWWDNIFGHVASMVAHWWDKLYNLF